MSERHQEMRNAGVDMSGRSQESMEAFQYAIAQARAALDAGVEPRSPEAAPVVARVNEKWAEVLGLPVGPELFQRLEEFGDPRAERYWQLIATINGWQNPVPDTAAERRWLTEAGR
jgi:hypothetical protein